MSIVGGTLTLLRHPEQAAMVRDGDPEIRFRGDMAVYGVHELPVAW